MDSTEEITPISPPKSHYVYANINMALAALCVGQAIGTWDGEATPVLLAMVVLLGVWLIVSQHLATFRASSRGALASVVLLPILVMYGGIAFIAHFAAPSRLTPPIFTGVALVGVVLLVFVILASRSNFRWSGVIEQARKSEDVELPIKNSSFTSRELSSVIGVVSVLLVTVLVFAQTVPANPEFYMRDVNPARARFNAPQTANYLIVQGLPDETILAEWTDAPRNFERWLVDQKKRPGVTNFQQHEIVEPVEYLYPNPYRAWGIETTQTEGQHATWQEGDRKYEVLWDNRYAEAFGELPVNYIERNIQDAAAEAVDEP